MRTILMLAAVATLPVPKPSALKTFRDWAVGCDNGNRCTLASLGPENGTPMPVTMALTIEAGGGGAAHLVLKAQTSAAAIAGLAIDGMLTASAGDLPRATVAALANSKSIAATDADGKTVARFSPAGLAAALRFVDAAQGRAGTVAAFVARGAKPAAAVPAPPALPVVASPPPSGSAGMPNAGQVAALQRSARCDVTGMATAQAFALGTGRTLVLVPCDAGAYNLVSAVFLIESGKPRPARFDTSPTYGEQTIVPTVANAHYAGGVLTSYAKARGLGDCGVSKTFAWDGAMFRLIEQAEMTDCRGNASFITTWRTVVRR